MRKLWNRPDYPIWSLVTRSQAGVFNLNICSYVTAVAMEPKVMLVAVYKGTQTRANLAVGEMVRLQLLAEAQAPLIRLLGQQSGKTVDKLVRLKKRHLIAEAGDWPYLTDACGYLDMTVTQVVEAGFDHDLAFCTVTRHQHLSAAPILTTTYLKEHKFIR